MCVFICFSVFSRGISLSRVSVFTGNDAPMVVLSLGLVVNTFICCAFTRCNNFIIQPFVSVVLRALSLHGLTSSSFKFSDIFFHFPRGGMRELCVSWGMAPRRQVATSSAGHPSTQQPTIQTEGNMIFIFIFSRKTNLPFHNHKKSK